MPNFLLSLAAYTCNRQGKEGNKKYKTVDKQFVNKALISGFRRDADEICALLGCYAVSCGNCLPTVRVNS
jgi:hypothetical protein